MPSLSVATFNVHWGGLTRRFFEYDVVGAIRAIDADVIVLQEVWWPDSGESFLTKLTEFEQFHVPKARARRLPPLRPYIQEDASNGWRGVAILSRLPIKDSRRVSLGRIPADRNPTQAIALVDVDVEGEIFTVAGFHASRDGMLTSSLHNLRRIAHVLDGVGELAVAGGDCNMWGPVVTQILSGWERVVKGKTWPAYRPHSQIDHLLIRKAGPISGSGVVLPELGSDHRAVRADLTF